MSSLISNIYLFVYLAYTTEFSEANDSSWIIITKQTENSTK